MWFLVDYGQLFESDMELLLIQNWDKIPQFSGFINPRRQVKLGTGDKIDVLAWDLVVGREVIIELKLRAGRADSQLIRYHKEFPDSLLVSITEMNVPENKRLDFIEYYTFEELFKSFSE